MPRAALVFAAFAASSSLAACATRIDLAHYDFPRELERLSRTPPPAPPRTEVTLSRVLTGASNNAAAFVYRGGSWSERRDSVYVGFLVRHPKGTLLLDTGLGTRIDDEVAGNSFLYRKVFAYEKKKAVVTQLKEGGLPPEDIKTIVVSHLHWDHAGGLRDFPGALVLTPKAERDNALTGGRPVFIKEQLDDPATKWKDLELQPQAYENFDQSLDFFDDGSVVLVPLPGHTPGSIGMFVNLASGARYFFIGDLTWSIEGMNEPTDRPYLSASTVDFDTDAVRRTIVKVYALMKARPNLIVVPAHDGRAQESIPLFPTFGRP